MSRKLKPLAASAQQKTQKRLTREARLCSEHELDAWQQREQTREMKRAVCRAHQRRLQERLMADCELSAECFASDKQRERKLRRIVEKRMAQVVHRSRSWAEQTRLSSRYVHLYSNRCLRTICAA